MKPIKVGTRQMVSINSDYFCQDLSLRHQLARIKPVVGVGSQPVFLISRAVTDCDSGSDQASKKMQVGSTAKLVKTIDLGYAGVRRNGGFAFWHFCVNRLLVGRTHTHICGCKPKSGVTPDIPTRG